MGKAKEKLADGGEGSSEEVTKKLKKRMKTLLKESENLRCSECRSKKHKPKWMALLEAPIDATQNHLGVFCCDACHLFFVALGEDLCKVKSLKNPEDCTLPLFFLLFLNVYRAEYAFYLASWGVSFVNSPSDMLLNVPPQGPKRMCKHWKRVAIKP